MPNAKSRAHAMAVAAKASGIYRSISIHLNYIWMLEFSLSNSSMRLYIYAGVSSVGITGEQKDRLEVIGEGIDVVCLVNRLREKVCVVSKCLRKPQLCHAEILLVEEVKEKKPEEKKKPEPEKKKPEEPKPCTCPPPCRCAAGYYHWPLPPMMVLCEEELPAAGGCHVM
ncbi:unnamed protein product [Urochloa decumbens]|uniref:Uncharacterized protein n=1 Tax=Urochloa decumbens TaxID=240449 RepID=A0ABC9D5Q0_9POAL